MNAYRSRRVKREKKNSFLWTFIYFNVAKCRKKGKARKKKICHKICFNAHHSPLSDIVCASFCRKETLKSKCIKTKCKHWIIDLYFIFFFLFTDDGITYNENLLYGHKVRPCRDFDRNSQFFKACCFSIKNLWRTSLKKSSQDSPMYSNTASVDAKTPH